MKFIRISFLLVLLFIFTLQNPKNTKTGYRLAKKNPFNRKTGYRLSKNKVLNPKNTKTGYRLSKSEVQKKNNMIKNKN